MAQIAISRHIYGSFHGYETLAISRDVDKSESKELASITFGQTSDKTYLDSLEMKPGYVCHKLRSGRWGITRVFKGSLDNHQRTTLLKITAIIEQKNWLHDLKCDINPIIFNENIWFWDKTKSLQNLVIETEIKKEEPKREILEKLSSLLFIIETYKNKEATIILKESEYEQEILRFVNIMLPLEEQKNFTYAIRCLSDEMPLSVITMSDIGSYGKSKRQTIYHSGYETADELNNQNKKCLITTQASDSDRRSDALYRKTRFLQESESSNNVFTEKYKTLSTASSRKKWLLFSLIFIVSLALIAISYYAIYRMSLNSRDVKVLEKSSISFLTKNAANQWLEGRDSAQRAKDIEECNGIIGKINKFSAGSNNKNLSDTREQLEEWLKWSEDASKEYEPFKTLLDTDLSFLKLPLKSYPDPNSLNALKKLADDLEAKSSTAQQLGPQYEEKLNKRLSAIYTFGLKKSDYLKSLEEEAVLPPIKQLKS
jgi:hypothetical protein